MFDRGWREHPICLRWCEATGKFWKARSEYRSADTKLSAWRNTRDLTRIEPAEIPEKTMKIIQSLVGEKKLDAIGILVDKDQLLLKINWKHKQFKNREDVFPVTEKDNVLVGVLTKEDGFLYLRDKSRVDSMVSVLTKEMTPNPVKYFCETGKKIKACIKCNKPLNDKQSLELGMGPVCYKRLGSLLALKD